MSHIRPCTQPSTSFSVHDSDHQPHAVQQFRCTHIQGTEPRLASVSYMITHFIPQNLLLSISPSFFVPPLTLLLFCSRSCMSVAFANGPSSSSTMVFFRSISSLPGVEKMLCLLVTDAPEASLFLEILAWRLGSLGLCACLCAAEKGESLCDGAGGCAIACTICGTGATALFTELDFCTCSRKGSDALAFPLRCCVCIFRM